MLQRLPLMLAALWWGSATAVGAWVVPMLFKHLGLLEERMKHEGTIKIEWGGE